MSVPIEAEQTLGAKANAGPAEVPRSGAYVWFVVVLLMLINVSSYADRGVLAILAPLIKSELQISDSYWGLIAGLAFAAPYALFSLPLAWLADRYTRRGVLAVAAAVWSGMTMCCGLAGNTMQLILARGGVGAGEAACLPAGHGIIGSVVRPEQRGLAMGVDAFGVPLGMVFATVLGGWVAHEFGWRTAFFVLGAPGLLLAALCWRLPRNKSAAPKQAKAVEIGADEPVTMLQLIKRRPAYMHMALVFGTGALFASARMSWLPSFYVRSYDFSIAETGIYYGLASGGASMLGVLLGGFVTSKLHKLGAKTVALYILSVLAVSTLFDALVVLSPYAWLSLSFNFLGGFVGFMGHGAIFALIQATAPEHLRTRASAVSTMLTALIGMSLGPVVVGVLSDLYSGFGAESLRYALLSASAIMLWPMFHVLMASRTIDVDSEQGWGRRAQH